MKYTVGIIGAMDEEVAILINKMVNKELINKAGMLYYVGELSGKDVVVVKCGIGKINAAVCSQILISEFKVNIIINSGVAGALDNKLNIGDIVVSRDTLNHDMDTTAFGDEYGVIPRMEESIFKGDTRLIKLALDSGKKYDVKVIEGRVLSGDQFIASKEKKDWLVKIFDGTCAEMEGVAIGQTAYLNNIPFLILRAISDKADGSAKVSYEDFKEEAIVNLSNILLDMLENIKDL